MVVEGWGQVQIAAAFSYEQLLGARHHLRRDFWSTYFNEFAEIGQRYCVRKSTLTWSCARKNIPSDKMVVSPDPVFHATVECRVGNANIHSWWHQRNQMEYINST